MTCTSTPKLSRTVAFAFSHSSEAVWNQPKVKKIFSKERGEIASSCGPESSALHRRAGSSALHCRAGRSTLHCRAGSSALHCRAGRPGYRGWIPAVQPSAEGRAQGGEGFFCTSHENQRTWERRTGLGRADAGRFSSAANSLWISLILLISRSWS